MTWFFRDVRFAIRKFLRAPGLAIAALATLLLGIGVNTAIFSLVDGIWLRPLQIADPAHLVAIRGMNKRAATDSEREAGSSYAELRDIREGVPAFADVAASSGRGVVVKRNGELRVLSAHVVSENYFAVLGTPAFLGHIPSEKEMSDTDPPVMVLSYSGWKNDFNGDPAIVGSIVILNHGTARIVAVLPPGFRGTDRFVDFEVYVSQSGWVTWVPEERNASRDRREFDLYARLRPGATLDQAREQLERTGAQLAAIYPATNTGRTFIAEWEPQSVDHTIKMFSLLLLAIAAAVLLIACVNILNLFLALNDARRREIAMRAALGATRGSLIRQILIEYCLLAVLGIAGAVLLAQRLIAFVPALLPNIGFPLGFDFRIDSRVLAFTIAAGLVSALVSGLIPGISSSQVSPLDATRTRVAPAGRFKMPARKGFVIAQLAISAALLMTTGLLVRTLIRIQITDMGFNRTQNAVLLNFASSLDGQRRVIEFQTLTERERALPGVKDVSIARVTPFPDTGGGATKIALAPGEAPTPTAGTAVWFNWVDDAYFRVMGVPLMRGRTFERQDLASSKPVAIVNQTMARKIFGSDDVIGKHFRIGRDKPEDTEIIGVARDGKYGGVTESPQPYLYLPLTKDAWSENTLIVTTEGDPALLLPAIRKALREVDPRALVMTAQTLRDHMRFATYTNRMAAWLTASLGALALLLTTVGLYGVTAYSVSRRTQEIGIRIALGAPRQAVFLAILRSGLQLSVTGLAIGTGLGLLLGRAISGLLYDVTGHDPVALVSMGALLIVICLAATAVPARRALRVDPIEALRDE